MGVVLSPSLVRTWVFRGILSSSNILKSVYKERLFSLCVTTVTTQLRNILGQTFLFPLLCNTAGTLQKKKKNLFIDLQETADLDTFLEEILNGKLHFYAVEVP